tara:strand:+ start:756 stop:974 length:219 start_codon:yes stop_codon:yes gene_type:complete
MTYIDKLNTTLDSPATSYWLANALRALDSRDPVDALNDVDALLAITEQRFRDIYPDDRTGCGTVRAAILNRN